MPNFEEEAEMLSWAGIDFGEEENYLLSKSLKRLAVMSGADSVKEERSTVHRRITGLHMGSLILPKKKCHTMKRREVKVSICKYSG
jgi:hypothetical protein